MARRRRPPARATKPVPEAGAPGSERLQKVLADAGIASRRDCELAIRAGRVRVNGRTVRELPCWVRAGQDLIEFDGDVVDTTRRTRQRQTYLYFAVNKPTGVISTASDPQGRTHVVSLVAAALPRGERVYPVGRLDADSSGLMLLTNDGELTHRLMHPRHEIGKTYLVTVEGSLDADAIASLKRGLYLADPTAITGSKGRRGGGGARRAAIASLQVLKSQRDRRIGARSLLKLTLREGQNREIRRLLARVGLKVRSLTRTAIGPLQLRGLKPGAWRALAPAEVAALKRAALPQALNRPAGHAAASPPSSRPAPTR